MAPNKFRTKIRSTGLKAVRLLIGNAFLNEILDFIPYGISNVKAETIN